MSVYHYYYWKIVIAVKLSQFDTASNLSESLFGMEWNKKFYYASNVLFEWSHG